MAGSPKKKKKNNNNNSSLCKKVQAAELQESIDGPLLFKGILMQI